MSDTEAFEPTVTNLSLGSCVQRFLCMRGQKSTHVPKKVGTRSALSMVSLVSWFSTGLAIRVQRF